MCTNQGLFQISGVVAGGGHGPPSDNFLGVLKSKGGTKISQLPM